MSNLVQLYDENKNKAYPIVNNKAIINEDGTSTIETIEKKITLNMNELKENMNDTYGNDINGIKEDVNDNKTSSDINKRKINSLIKMGEGVTHEFINDEENGYMKDIPNNAKLATIKKFGGRTIVWNQMNDTNYVNSIAGSSTDFYKPTINNTGLLVVNGTFNASKYIYAGYLYAIPYKNHTYYCRLEYYNAPKLPSGTNLHIRIDNASTGATLIGGNNLSSVYTKVSENGRLWVYLQFINPNKEEVTFTNFQFRISVYDLSLMFGIGKEPSEAEFEQMFQNRYYEYCPPKVVHLGLDDIGVRGTQMFDVYGAKKYWTPKNATYPDNYTIENNKIIIQKNLLYGYSYPYRFSDTLTNVTVTSKIITNTATNPRVCISKSYLLDKSNTHNFYEGEKQTKLCTNVNAIFLDYQTAGSGNPIFTIEDLMISKSPTEVPWKPYNKDVYEIPDEIKNLDGYGWGIGDVYNYIDLETKTYHKRVGCMDLGTLNWRWVCYDTENTKYYLVIDHRGQNNVKPEGYFLCEKYIRTTKPENDNKVLCIGINEMKINDSSFTDLTSAKNSLKGVLLYYELKEEVITDISDIIPEGFLESLPLEEYGAIIFENSKTSGHVPIPNSIEYLCELTKTQ